MSRTGKRRDSSGSDASISRIPVSYTPSLPRKQRPTLNRHRSLQCLSQSLCSPRSPEEDTESIRSGVSGCSLSSQCDHAHFARNGTTYSGRDKRFIVHCSPTHVEPDRYLTPTQRANATIRRLQSVLSDSQAEIADKEQEIAKLTKELVQLRLIKAESQALTNGHSAGGGDARLSVETTPCSLADSGHFEDISPQPSPRNTPNGEKEILKIKTQYEDQVRSLQEANNAKIESLVQRLAEANDKYYELRPQYDKLQKKIEELEKEKEELVAKYKDNEEKHKSTYLQMFNKGQEAALFSVDDTVTDGPAKADTLPALIKQLEVTKSELESVKDVDFWERARAISGKEAVSIWNLCRKTMYRRLLESRKPRSEQDAEVTLQFLKSAVYYFLTDRENTTGHLAAIQSILGFTREERNAIERASAAYTWK
ncbi:GRIP domain-containing protein quick-to-court isoform X2 [Rhodnius prolixus]|uniref:GRIP domain-containing protein quick-to-court isoform X2 n=1 Tax=Rhodnius prolixus TaxID=13249 RepID=UPI003D18F4B6